MRRFHFILLLSGLFVSLIAKSQQFDSALLKALAGRVRVSIPAGIKGDTTFITSSYKGKPLSVEMKNGIVTHIGYHLFLPEMKAQDPSPIYNFLERYFLELASWQDPFTLNQKMVDDKFGFVKGELKSIYSITDSTSFYVQSTDNRYYEAVWPRNDGKEILHVVFPVDYQLLSGRSKIELEKNAFRDISTAKKSIEENLDVSELEMTHDGLFRTVPQNHYEVATLNDCRYYVKTTNEQYELLADTAYLYESACNLMLCSSASDFPLMITQKLYGGESQNFSASLQQWLSYCKSSHIKLYCAVEEEYEGGLRLLVLGENKEFGYNHMMSVYVPRDFLSRPGCPLRAELNAYIPTHNMKSLYETYRPKKKKKI